MKKVSYMNKKENKTIAYKIKYEMAFYFISVKLKNSELCMSEC